MIAGVPIVAAYQNGLGGRRPIRCGNLFLKVVAAAVGGLRRRIADRLRQPASAIAQPLTPEGSATGIEDRERLETPGVSRNVRLVRL